MPIEIIDYKWPQISIYRDTRKSGAFKRLCYPKWDYFSDEKCRTIFERGGLIVDIGGGLRIDNKRGSWADPASQKKFLPYLSDPKVNFKITDYTDKYNPDYVEDIHKLSFPGESVDAIFCIAVLEHVYDPKKAAEEIMRVLKKDGLAFIYVPFLYRYHAHKEDYRDYFRYSKDGINYLFRECSSIEICPVRGIFESLLKLTPFNKISSLCLFARFLDHCCERMRQTSEMQTSGYHVFIRK